MHDTTPNPAAPAPPPAQGSARVDSWLWAVRLYPTRTAAGTACRGGHVRINGRTAKPAAKVSAGDRVEARVGTRGGTRQRSVEVVSPIEKRVGAPVAVTCFVDHTPPEPEVPRGGIPERARGAGRPTKRDRRQLDRLRGQDR